MFLKHSNVILKNLTYIFQGCEHEWGVCYFHFALIVTDFVWLWLWLAIIVIASGILKKPDVCSLNLSLASLNTCSVLCKSWT